MAKSAVVKVDYIDNFEVFSVSNCHPKLRAHQYSDFVSIYETSYIVKAMPFQVIHEFSVRFSFAYQEI